MGLHEATKRLNIIYIHGFASIGNGEKNKFLQRYYKGTSTRVFSPDLPPNPTLAVKTLIELIKGIPKGEISVAIGTLSIPAQTCHPFRAIPATCSGERLPGIPG